jgi:hypothetical protein
MRFGGRRQIVAATRLADANLRRVLDLPTVV